MRKTLIAILVSTLMLLAVPSAVASTGSAAGVAVYKDQPYLITVNATVTSGNGTVYIIGVAGDRLFRESLIEACYLASWIQGIDPWSLNYYIHISINGLNTTRLVGPSLSLTTFIAVTQAFENKIPRTSQVVITGMVNPDGTVGFVSDVDVKGELAEILGYPYYMYPALQENRYKIVEEQVKTGVFTFETTSIVVEESILRNLSIQKVPVISVLDALHFLDLYSDNRPQQRNITYVLRSNSSYNILQFLLERTKNRLTMLQETYKAASERSISSPVEKYGEELREIEALLDAYRSSVESSNGQVSWSQAELLVQAYEKSTRLYYYNLIRNKALGSTLAEFYLAKSIATRLISMMQDRIPRYGLGYAIEASYLYTGSINDFNKTILLLLGYMSGLDHSSKTANQIAYSLARSTADLYRSALLAGEALALPGDVLETTDIRDLLVRELEYTIHLKNYATDYASVSRVRSDMILLAHGYVWLAQKYNKENATFTDLLVALGHLMRASTLYSTYLALHPGFVNVSVYRLQGEREILGILTGYVWLDPVKSYFENYISMNTVEDEVYFNQLMINYAKLYLIADLDYATLRLDPNYNYTPGGYSSIRYEDGGEHVEMYLGAILLILSAVYFAKTVHGSSSLQVPLKPRTRRIKPSLLRFKNSRDTGKDNSS